MGTDISGTALSALSRKVSHLSQVELLQRAADDFSGFAADSFDGVIVNEVAQYFPSVDYIAKVVEGAVSVTRPGGFIFLGGMRSQPLLEAFHSSVALYQAGDSLPIAELRQEVQRRMGQDKELVVAPELFAVLAQRLGTVDEVSVQLRGGGRATS